MINSATADLESAATRVRFFNTQTIASVAEQYPMLPVNAPCVPPPGAGLVAQSHYMGDPPPDPTKVKGRRVAARPNGPWLTGLVRSVLYCGDASVPVAGRPTVWLPGVSQVRDGEPRYGPDACRLVVVGKCLDEVEVNSRMPFRGRGSEYLWRAWDEAGLPRPGAALPTFLTNVLRYAPDPAQLSKQLSKDQVADARHLLWQEFAVCRPAVVLLLGADAAKAVLGRGAKVADYRGRGAEVAADFRPTPGAPADPWRARVVVADHPAAVSRDPDLYPTFLSGVRFLARALGCAPDFAAVPLDHRAVYALADLEREVAASEAASAGGGYVAFDCEWDGAHPSNPGAYLYTVQWSHAPGHARVAFLKRCGGADNPDLPRPQTAALLARLLGGAPARGARLVAHFAKGDLAWLHAYGVDLYDAYVGPRDDPPDLPGRLNADQKTYTEGAFDTYVAAHAVSEAAIKKLEVMAAADFGLDRYDAPIQTWKEEYCRTNKVSQKALTGYGHVPESIITPYACLDSDVCGREYLLYNGDPVKGTRGRLDRDEFGLSSRPIFAVRMRAWAALAEMERYGMEVDAAEHARLTRVLADRYAELLAEFRAEIGWPGFTLSRRAHLVEFLFGEQYAAPAPDDPDAAPQGALRLYLEPYKATDKYNGDLWPAALARARDEGGARPAPAADKETLVILSRQNALVRKLLDLGTLATAMKVTFRPPAGYGPPAGAADDPDGAPGADGDPVHEAGLVAHLRGDGAISTMIRLVETGRCSSSKPNLQNITSSVDEKLNAILGWDKKKDGVKAQKFVSRSVFRARPGWFLADADLKGAEIAAAGWQSDDRLLIEHARRTTLDERDPEWLDLHSDLAAGAFGLTCPLAEVKEKHKALRVAAKRARFGHYYGAAPETIHRQCLLDSPDVTLEQVERIVAGHDQKYPVLARYFARARARVGKQGWLRNGYGGTRRFRPVADRGVRAGYERAGQNWTCQGLVADHISEALGKLWYRGRDLGLRSRIVLSVHDSIVMECPADEIAFVHDELLPWAMGWGSPVTPTDLAGVPTGRPAQCFGVSIAVCQTWGIDLADWRERAARAA